MFSSARRVSRQRDALKMATAILILGIVVLSLTACREAGGPGLSTEEPSGPESSAVANSPADDEEMPVSPETDGAAHSTNVNDAAHDVKILSSVEADGPDPSNTIYFPQVREDRDVPDAEIEGELVLEDGCIRVARPSGFSHLLVWPQRVNLSVDGVDIGISYDSRVLFSVGDKISIGGGEVPLYHLQTLVEQPIPSECPGPYWLVGGIPGVPRLDL